MHYKKAPKFQHSPVVNRTPNLQKRKELKGLSSKQHLTGERALNFLIQPLHIGTNLSLSSICIRTVYQKEVAQ
jgi:hypothetical protein